MIVGGANQATWNLQPPELDVRGILDRRVLTALIVALVDSASWSSAAAEGDSRKCESACCRGKVYVLEVLSKLMGRWK